MKNAFVQEFILFSFIVWNAHFIQVAHQQNHIYIF